MSKSDLSCKVCGSKLLLNENFHYIARDETTTGLVTLGRHDEESLYDAFDCPICGCQNIVGERKREYVEAHKEEVITIEENEIKEEQKQKCFGSYDEEDMDCLLCTVEDECKKVSGDKNEK